MKMNMTREEYIAGLKKFTKWLEKHPEVPAPSTGHSWSPVSWWAEDKKEFAAIVKALGKGTKDVSNSYFTFRGQKGMHTQVTTSRETVCVKKVVGTKHIEGQIIPAHDEEIVEWDCKPVLEGSNGEKAINVSDVNGGTEEVTKTAEQAVV